MPDSVEEGPIDDEPLEWSAIAERRYESVSAAFRHRPTDLGNRPFIEKFLHGVDVEGLYERGSYIMVARQSGAPALRIHFGYTNGFRSEAEIVKLLGDVERWPSQRGHDLWGVTHPVHGAQHGSSARRGQRREQTECPDCGALMPLTGICDNCG